MSRSSALCWLALLSVCMTVSAQFDASYYNTFTYSTRDSCSPLGTGNVAETLAFAIQYPPYDGQCHQCFSLCSKVPYRFTFDNSSAGASFSMSVYNDIGVCNETNVAWQLAAKSATADISCTQGTFIYVPNATTTTLYYTISSSGGNPGWTSTGSSVTVEKSMLMSIIIGVVVVVAVIAVAVLGYLWYKRNRASREAEAGGEPGQYSTLA